MGWLAAGFTELPVAAGLLLVALPGTMVGVPVLAAGLIALPVAVAGVVPLVAGALVPVGLTATTPWLPAVAAGDAGAGAGAELPPDLVCATSALVKIKKARSSNSRRIGHLFLRRSRSSANL